MTHFFGALRHRSVQLVFQRAEVHLRSGSVTFAADRSTRRRRRAPLSLCRSNLELRSSAVLAAVLQLSFGKLPNRFVELVSMHGELHLPAGNSTFGGGAMHHRRGMHVLRTSVKAFSNVVV